MATAPVYYSDQAIKDYIALTYGNLSGDALYSAIATEASKQGVPAEQIARALGVDVGAVNKYATNIGKPLVSEEKALNTVIDYAYNTQYGRDATTAEKENASKYLTTGGTSTGGTGVLNYSTEGYNYDTQSIIAGYRSALGRNPTQTEYVSEMAKLGYDPFNPSVLGAAGKLSATVGALESDPFAGRYANTNPYGIYDAATQTYNLGDSLPNISQNIQGNSVQFISPVTQKPIVTSFENGKLVVKEGVNTLTGEQAQSAINLALNTGALAGTEYKILTNALGNAKSIDDVYKAFSTPEAVVALDPKYGFELGVGQTLNEAKKNSAGVQNVVDYIARTNAGNLPSAFDVSKLAEANKIPFQFGQTTFDKSFLTDANKLISTQAKAPTSQYNFNPANIYQEPIVAGQMRELFPSFGESKRLAQGLINERPTTQSIVNMIQGLPADSTYGLQDMQRNVVAAPTSLNNVLGLISK
jgi:hypothetical protein